MSFNLAGRDPFAVAEALGRAGVEARAGCHCATLAHRALRLTPRASCRLSFVLDNTVDDVDRALAAVESQIDPLLRSRGRRPAPARSGVTMAVLGSDKGIDGDDNDGGVERVDGAVRDPA